MKGKSEFTRKEADEIIFLIRQKLKANTNDQKGIRNKIRALDFYASDFGIGGGYTEHDFLRVVKIIGGENKITNVLNPINKSLNPQPIKESGKRSSSDETYILDLCDEVLRMEGLRQHRFDFLIGDSGTKLPVDIYYPSLKLSIEYCEKQHSEPVKLFDRRQTVSGVTRGEQRKLYDQRRREVLPKHGIELIEFSYHEFEHDRNKRLVRNKEMDIKVIHIKLSQYKM